MAEQWGMGRFNDGEVDVDEGEGRAPETQARPWARLSTTFKVA